MEEQINTTEHKSTGVWVLILVCMGAIILALAGGAAYTGISSARLSAAKASAGQIESVFLLAEMAATSNGLPGAGGSLSQPLKSFEDATGTTLNEYEQFLLDNMLAAFGPKRDFDFSVERLEDGNGVHLQIQYFPIKGRTSPTEDRFYVALDGVITEKNTV